jgi:predicted kinase
VAVLVLLNGAPGVGKSTLADLLVRQRPMMLALDVDRIKHALGRWDDDAEAAGVHARRLAVALIREHLAAGYDVAVAQYLARTDFIEDLEKVSRASGAQFLEVILFIDVSTLARRLRRRQARPDRSARAPSADEQPLRVGVRPYTLRGGRVSLPHRWSSARRVGQVQQVLGRCLGRAPGSHGPVGVGPCAALRHPRAVQLAHPIQCRPPDPCDATATRRSSGADPWLRGSPRAAQMGGDLAGGRRRFTHGRVIAASSTGYVTVADPGVTACR